MEILGLIILSNHYPFRGQTDESEKDTWLIALECVDRVHRV